MKYPWRVSAGNPGYFQKAAWHGATPRGGGGRDRGREEIGERDGTEPKIGSQGEEEEEEVNKRGRGRKGEEGIEGGGERKKRR